jgi:hypothetical protein
MKRSLVFALLLSVGHGSAALAGRGPHDADFASWGGKETLLQSGQRITRQVAEARPAAPSIALDAKRLRIERAFQPALQAQTTLAQSGMRKRTKLLIAMGIVGAFAGVAVAVDRGVEDSTPSSLGQR